MPSSLCLAVLVIVFGALMFWQSKKAKEQQQEQKDFRANLQPGTEVITIGRVIGKVVEVDNEYDEIVIDSEGSKMRFALSAIAREYIRPAYVSDDEVDEYGNPLPKNEIENASEDSEADSTEAAADGDQQPAEAAVSGESKND
ncbi:preprotein translocase, YajC subunit [Bifidobacterium sp. DSM 109960]|uniref:Preprotein translocase, YajC subunit n=1 Tax=Bifidobacterium erythrocebi TaxID=2675325 RepID=A0A7Y0EVI9_9BIFI|nr:preprotein translocase, YajC subunit [Bifidobacterium sp. DSM 109960]